MWDRAIPSGEAGSGALSDEFEYGQELWRGEIATDLLKHSAQQGQ
jgi:hypothetical protein